MDSQYVPPCGRTSPMYYDNTDHHGLAGHKRLRGGKEKMISGNAARMISHYKLERM